MWMGWKLNWRLLCCQLELDIAFSGNGNSFCWKLELNTALLEISNYFCWNLELDPVLLEIDNSKLLWLETSVSSSYNRNSVQKFKIVIPLWV